MATANNRPQIVLVDGCRIPFQKPDSGYKNFELYNLAGFAIRGLIDRTKIPPHHIDRVILGSMACEAKTDNIARDATISADLPATIPAHTVSMSCLSAHQAITSGMEQIMSGQAEVIIAGGADKYEALQKSPLHDRPLAGLRKQQSSSFYLRSQNWIKKLRSIRPADLLTGNDAIDRFEHTDALTTDYQGLFADRMASSLDISREQQDAYTVRSHQSTVKAYHDKLPDKELVFVTGPPDFEVVSRDNTYSKDCTLQKLGSLKPAFTGYHGTVTEENSSSYSDGAAAVLIMPEKKAGELGLRPKVRLNSFIYTAVDPKSTPYPAAAFAIAKLLDQSRIELDEVDIFELHESFAGQVIAVIKTLGSPEFARDYLGKGNAAGTIPLKKVNLLGGSLALGHPPGATGARLVATAAQRLKYEDKKYAIAASGTPEGTGHAMLLETINHQNS